MFSLLSPLFLSAATARESWQTPVALGVVAGAVLWLVWRTWFARKPTGCGGGACAAISPEVKRLKARLAQK
ncbi:MAG TPA: hypothetical protein PKX00_23720 [Opitutaceae bacterium]|jgi:hypothetical protein|nr:hypothetical protein [Opitutaceae bacterium]HRE08650.1 hypothetical protein [Opitutaceae bacterium]